MPITEQGMEHVKRILMDGAKTHFPPIVQFQDANATVRLDADEEEYIDAELLHTTPTPVLDGHLMNPLFRVTDEPMRASGINVHTQFEYTDVKDPTKRQ